MYLRYEAEIVTWYSKLVLKLNEYILSMGLENISRAISSSKKVICASNFSWPRAYERLGHIHGRGTPSKDLAPITSTVRPVLFDVEL